MQNHTLNPVFHAAYEGNKNIFDKSNPHGAAYRYYRNYKRIVVN